MREAGKSCPLKNRRAMRGLQQNQRVVRKDARLI